ncbi:MAG: hypothetical protein HY553_20820, partial [Elusimicrobia bacterium]|nr:hypothetical protein [Elusimicrobiota bacterium]
MHPACRRIVASSLAALTVLLSPGLTPYQALAQTVGPQAAGGTAVSGLGSAAGAAGQSAVPSQGAPLTAATLSAPVLTRAALVAPAVLPRPATRGEGRTEGAVAGPSAKASPSRPLSPAARGRKYAAPRRPVATAGELARAAAAPAKGPSVFSRAAHAVDAVGKAVAGGIGGPKLTERLHQVFDNGRKAAAEDSEVPGKQGETAPNGLKAAETPDNSPSLEHTPPPAPPKTETHGIARDFYDVFVSPLVGAVKTLAYPLRHPIVSAKAVARAVRHPIRTAQELFARGTGGAAASLADFNASEKAYLTGQAVFLFAISVYIATLPLLVKALTG